MRSVPSPRISNVSVEFTIASIKDYDARYQLFALMQAKVDDAQGGFQSKPKRSWQTQVPSRSKTTGANRCRINQANTRHLGLLPGYSLEWKGEFGNSAVANAGLASTMPRSCGCVRCHRVF